MHLTPVSRSSLGRSGRHYFLLHQLEQSHCAIFYVFRVAASYGHPSVVASAFILASCDRAKALKSRVSCLCQLCTCRSMKHDQYKRHAFTERYIRLAAMHVSQMLLQ